MARSLHSSIIVGALLALWWAAPALACDDQDEDGMDVGLVLSGGGALATTQIGALTAIERLGVPIHCVVGASMGSVVGALYAAGYDADMLRAVFRDSRWPEVFSGRVGRRDEPYLRKEQDDLYLSGYIAGFDRNGLRLPAGFRSMSGLQSLYRQLLDHVPAAQDFDRLPIPYRAVAMDLSTGEAVALGEGDLVEAMLASMAVPGVFSPRNIEGRTLVDGGLAAQLPVHVAHAMGADLIIALDTTVEPPAAEDSWSVGQVSQQLIRITVWRNWQDQERQLGPRDVLIRPDLTGLTTSSFERAEDGFDSGEREALRYQEQLLAIKRLAAPPLPPRPPAQDLRPKTLLVENRSVIDGALIAKRFDYRPDDLDDPEAVHRKLRNLASFGPFGETDLAVLDAETAMLRVEPLGLGRNLLNVGLRASNNFDGDSQSAILGRYSRRPFGPTGSELRVSGQVGTDLGITAEFYQPFGEESRFFMIPALGYRAETLTLELAETRLGEFWQETGEARLRFGRELGHWGVLAVEGIFETVRARTELAVVELPRTETEDQAGVGVLFGIDTLDQAEWPVLGIQLRASAQRLEQFGDNGGTANRYQVKAVKPFQLGPASVLLRAEAQSLDYDEGNISTILQLGGFRQLSAFAEKSLLSDGYKLGSVEVFRRLNPSDALVSVPLYLGVLAEYADVELDLLGPAFSDEYYSVGGYLGTDTVLGPLFLGTAFGNGGNHSVFVHFGRSF